MWNFNDNNGSNSFIWHILNTIWAIFKILQAEIHWSDTFLPLFFSRHLRLCSANHEINPPKWLKMAARSAIWSPWSKRFACQTKWRASELKHYAIPIPALFSRPRIKKSYNFDRKRWNLMIVQRDNSLERGEIREIKYIKERFRKKINAHYQLFEAPELLWAAAAVHTAVFVDAGHDDWWWSGIRTHLSLSLITYQWHSLMYITWTSFDTWSWLITGLLYCTCVHHTSYVRGGLRTTDSQTGRIDPARLNYRTGTEN